MIFWKKLALLSQAKLACTEVFAIAAFLQQSIVGAGRFAHVFCGYMKHITDDTRAQNLNWLACSYRFPTPVSWCEFAKISLSVGISNEYAGHWWSRTYFKLSSCRAVGKGQPTDWTIKQSTGRSNACTFVFGSVTRFVAIHAAISSCNLPGMCSSHAFRAGECTFYLGVYGELRGTKRSLCLYVFQSLKFITSASTNFDLHILALSSVNLQWMPLKSLYDSTPSTHLRLSSALHWTSYLCSDFAQVLDVRWLGLVLVGGGSAFGSGKKCSWCYLYVLDAMLSTLRSQLSPGCYALNFLK